MHTGKDNTHMDLTTVRRIKEAADILDVVSQFVDLKKHGANRWEGKCPFHDDRHAGSFVVVPNKNLCTCYSCGITYKPVDFLMRYGAGMTYPEALAWLADRYGIPLDGGAAPVKRVQRVARVARELPTLVMPREWVVSRLWNHRTSQTTSDPSGGADPFSAIRVENPLLEWMFSLGWKDGGERLCHWLTQYGVGTSTSARNQGWTIWWCIDEQKRVRQGKLMKYRGDGHRDKDAAYNFDTIGAITRRQGLWSDKDWEVRTCLFGLHLLDAYPEAEVCIVESEKTAVLAQCFVDPKEKLFMATGSKGNLTKGKLKEVMDAHRWLILYPDIDGLEEWKARAAEMGYDRMNVSDVVTRLYDPDKDSPKSDIADILVRMQAEGSTGIRLQKHDKRMQEEAVVTAEQRLERVMDEYPAARVLVEKLGLKVMY